MRVRNENGTLWVKVERPLFPINNLILCNFMFSRDRAFYYLLIRLNKVVSNSDSLAVKKKIMQPYVFKVSKRNFFTTYKLNYFYPLTSRAPVSG